MGIAANNPYMAEFYTSTFMIHRREADAYVVSYNPKILALFGGHVVNVEFSGSVNLIMYLYKVSQLPQ